MTDKIQRLMRTDPKADFAYVEPPFAYNASIVNEYPLEISGFNLLSALYRRLGWSSLDGKKLLDYGCGVRFTRTIINLGLDIGHYTGIDINKEAVDWLSEAMKADGRFTFHHIPVGNSMYNPDGKPLPETYLSDLGFSGFDAVCMFSVITHQNPDEALATLKMLRHCTDRLYFTAFVRKHLTQYEEGHPDKPGLVSNYGADLLIGIVEQSGWTIDAIYEPTKFQQTGFVCSA